MKRMALACSHLVLFSKKLRRLDLLVSGFMASAFVGRNVAKVASDRET